MIFIGPVTLPSGLIASYHKVVSISFNLSQELVQLDVLSWGSEEAMLNGYQNDRQIVALPFSEVNGLSGIMIYLKNRLIANDGPLAGTTEYTP